MDRNLVMKELQKPFKEDEIEWRVGATNTSSSLFCIALFVT